MATSVDFLLPIKSPAPFLGETLGSVTKQTYRDWRLVAVVDGFSTETASLLREIIPAAQLVVVEHERSLGLIQSLNEALGVSTARYCARLDADDIAEPERLQVQLEFMTRNPGVAMLGSSATLIDHAGSVVGTHKVATDNLRRRLLLRNQFVHSSVLFNRVKIRDLGAYAPEAFRREDYQLWLRVAASHRIANLSQPLVRYRISEGQESSGHVPRASLKSVTKARVALAQVLDVGMGRTYVQDLAWRLAQSTSYRNAVGRLAMPTKQGRNEVH